MTGKRWAQILLRLGLSNAAIGEDSVALQFLRQALLPLSLSLTHTHALSLIHTHFLTLSLTFTLSRTLHHTLSASLSLSLSPHDAGALELRAPGGPRLAHCLPAGTLHPQPYTLNTTPYTLNTTPCTLNPTPYTHNPTLNPQPSTLIPTP